MQEVVNVNYNCTAVKRNLLHQMELITLQIKIKISHWCAAEELTRCIGTPSERLSFDFFKSDSARIWVFFKMS